MHNEEPFLIYLDYTGFNFMPGIREGYMPGTRCGKSGQRDARIAGHQVELAELGKQWTGRWLGMDYVEAKKTWQLLKEEGPTSSFASEIIAKTPALDSMLPSDIQQTLNKYYKKLSAVERQFKAAQPNVKNVRSDTAGGDTDNTDHSLEPQSDADTTNVDTENETSIDSSDSLSDSDDDAEGSIDEDHNAECSGGGHEPDSVGAVSALLGEDLEDIVMDDGDIQADGDLNGVYYPYAPILILTVMLFKNSRYF